MKNKSVYLETALDSICRIKDYTEGFQADEFLTDKKTQDAVIRFQNAFLSVSPSPRLSVKSSWF